MHEQMSGVPCRSADQAIGSKVIFSIVFSISLSSALPALCHNGVVAESLQGACEGSTFAWRVFCEAVLADAVCPIRRCGTTPHVLKKKAGYFAFVACAAKVKTRGSTGGSGGDPGGIRVQKGGSASSTSSAPKLPRKKNLRINSTHNNSF